MQLRLVTEPAEFGALQASWDRLLRRCPRPCVFHSHEWLDAAWQWRRLDATLYLMCCEHEGELVGVLPLIRPRNARSRRWRALEFLSVADTQRCDVLVAADAPASVLPLLADELRKRQSDWDVLRFRYLPADAVALRSLQPALVERGFKVDIKSGSPNPWVDLQTGWDAYYATRSRRLKKAVNLSANRLADAGTVEIRWLESRNAQAADVERVVDDATSISARSWKTRTGNSLDRVGPQAFIRQLARHAQRRGWLSIWTLLLDGSPAAMEFQLVADGEVFALRSDFDAALENVSPGSHLNRRMLETLFGRDLRRYVMGPGENAYKYRWASGADPVHEMTVYARTWRGRALAAWELSVKPVARRVRDRLRRASRAQDVSEAQTAEKTPGAGG